MTPPSYPASKLHYDLPQELIAQQPPVQRGGSRLLHVRVAEAAFSDHSFEELPNLLPDHCALVMNDSRVIPARVHGHRASGAQVELLYHRWMGNGRIEAVLGSNAKLNPGELILLPESWRAELLTPKSRNGTALMLHDGSGQVATLDSLLGWLERCGAPPLPPYIKRHEKSASDAERYQTVYASAPGSVAAPTAGLHFTDEMLASLRSAGHPLRQLTLHVGLATFAPLRVDDLADHAMHSEAYSLPAGLHAELAQWHAAGRPICAVGTTSLRVLHTIRTGLELPAAADPVSEAATESGPAVTGETAAFIYPGHGTNAADLLLTNFHLPGSTLLALVYAFGGENLMHTVYHHAIAKSYRFFSYGDCMLIDRRGARLTADGTVVR